jgi:hypothetical protein
VTEVEGVTEVQIGEKQICGARSSPKRRLMVQIR